MRVLALYDIHGNVEALEAVLADPRAAHPDVVMVGGDAVPGPDGQATLARLEALGPRTPSGIRPLQVALSLGCQTLSLASDERSPRMRAPAHRRGAFGGNQQSGFAAVLLTIQQSVTRMRGLLGPASRKP